MSVMRRIPFPQNLTRTVDRRPTRVAYALPTLFTAANMFFGFVALMKVFDGAMLMVQHLPGANLQFVLAAQMVGLAVLMDGLDGRIARMTNTTSDFGREMDSMADAITFGVAPAVLGFTWGFYGVDVSGNEFARDHLLRIGSFVCFLFLLAGCARLARFNITTNPTPKNPGRPDRKYFVGLPIPASAGLAVAVVYAANGRPITWWPLAVIWLLLMALLAFLMVCTWRYRSFKDLNLNRPRSPLLFVFLASLIYLMWNYSQVMLLVLGVMYVGSGIAVRIGGLLSRAFRPAAGAKA
jgi:CDP-diacylglycerol---serine O-phosphatidyltransferase